MSIVIPALDEEPAQVLPCLAEELRPEPLHHLGVGHRAAHGVEHDPLHPLGVEALVLVGRVVPLLALRAGQRDLVPHLRLLASHGGRRAPLPSSDRGLNPGPLAP